MSITTVEKTTLPTAVAQEMAHFAYAGAISFAKALEETGRDEDEVAHAFAFAGEIFAHLSPNEQSLYEAAGMSPEDVCSS